MSFKHITLAIFCVLLLSACSSESSKQTESSSTAVDTTQENRNEDMTVSQNDQTSEEQQSSVVSHKEQASQKQESVKEKTETPENTSPTQEEVKQPVQQKEPSKKDGIEGHNENVETVGYSVVEGDVDEAEDIPKQDQMNILAAFNEYIDAFNDQDLNRYERVLARNPEGFDLQEDLMNTKNIFENFDMKRTASNITITDYTGNRANVYADILVEVTQNDSEVRDEGKQLTQFVKESSGWKITSLQAIGSAANQGQ